MALSSIEEAWKHLANVTTVPVWQKPDGANDDQVLFMTTCMETWIVADRKTLREHYGTELQEGALPPINQLEQRDRHDVQNVSDTHQFAIERNLKDAIPKRFSRCVSRRKRSFRCRAKYYGSDK